MLAGVAKWQRERGEIKGFMSEREIDHINNAALASSSARPPRSIFDRHQVSEMAALGSRRQ